MWYPSIYNLERTSFGVKVETRTEQLASYYQTAVESREAGIGKIASAALVYFSLGFKAKACFALAAAAVAVVTFGSAPLVIKVGCIAVALFGAVNGLLLLDEVLLYFDSRCKMRKDESDVIDLLGGQEAFDLLPTLNDISFASKEFDWQINSDKFKDAPIIKGVDNINRPFVVFNFMNESTGERERWALYRGNCEEPAWSYQPYIGPGGYVTYTDIRDTLPLLKKILDGKLTTKLLESPAAP